MSPRRGSEAAYLPVRYALVPVAALTRAHLVGTLCRSLTEVPLLDATTAIVPWAGDKPRGLYGMPETREPGRELAQREPRTDAAREVHETGLRVAALSLRAKDATPSEVQAPEREQPESVPVARPRPARPL